MKQLVLISGPDCSLCDQAKALIEKVRAEVPFDFETRDLADDEGLRELYARRIPVILLDGELVLEGKVTEFWLRKALAGEPVTRYKLF